MRKNLLLLLAVVLVMIGALIFLYLRPAEGELAVITVDGAVVKTIDLSAVTGTQTFTITTHQGENVIEAERGRIRIVEADCPDGICVATGWITAGDLPIVCLPHRLVITIETGSESEIDGVTG